MSASAVFVTNLIYTAANAQVVKFKIIPYLLIKNNIF